MVVPFHVTRPRFQLMQGLQTFIAEERRQSSFPVQSFIDIWYRRFSEELLQNLVIEDTKRPI